jgi:hypothetical protein
MTSKWSPYLVIGTISFTIAVLLAGVYFIGAVEISASWRFSLVGFSLTAILVSFFGPYIVRGFWVLFGGAPLLSDNEAMGLSMVNTTLLGVGQLAWAVEIIALRRDLVLHLWAFTFLGVMYLVVAIFFYRRLKTAK